MAFPPGSTHTYVNTAPAQCGCYYVYYYYYYYCVCYYYYCVCYYYYSFYSYFYFYCYVYFYVNCWQRGMRRGKSDAWKERRPRQRGQIWGKLFTR